LMLNSVQGKGKGLGDDPTSLEGYRKKPGKDPERLELIKLIKPRGELRKFRRLKEGESFGKTSF